MKPLFLSIAIIGAISLWYSNAHAANSRHSNGNHASSQSHSRSFQHQRHESRSGDSRRASDSGNHRGSQRSDNHHGSQHSDSGNHRGSQRSDNHHGSQHSDSGRHGGFRHSDYRNHNGSRHSEYRGDDRRDHRSGYRSRVDNRQYQQRERIQQASHSGNLTREERKSLWGEQRQIAAKEREFRADGRLSRDEREVLQHDLTMASQHIYNESHDSDRR